MGEVNKVYVGVVIILFFVDGGFDIVDCCIIVSVLWFDF